MAQTFWLDPVSGSDNYSGSNKTLLATASLGVSNGTTTFVDASGLFTAGMVGQYINILTKAQYKITAFTNSTTITLSGSPSTATTLTWYVGGPCLSLAHFTNALTGIAASDSINIAKSPDITRVLDTAGTGLNATFTNLSQTITLSGSVGATKDINVCDSTTNWTAGTNVTFATSASSKQGTNCLAFTISSSFLTAGIVGYYATGSAIDLSLFQNLCAWFKTSTASAAGLFQIRLCSDTVGATPIVSFNVGALSANNWLPSTWFNGSALSASVNSVSIYATAGTTKNLFIDNLFAANALTLTSLVTTDTSATVPSDGPWPCQSIVTAAGVTTIKIDQGSNTVATTVVRGYSGTTQTVAIYARETSRCALQSCANNSGSRVTVSGGWNLSTGNQDGFTWLDPGDVSGNALTCQFQPFTFGALGLARGTNGIVVNANTGAHIFSGPLVIVGGSTSGFNYQLNLAGISITGAITVVSCNANGIILNGGSLGANLTISGALSVYSCGSSGIPMQAQYGVKFTGAIISNNTGNHGVTLANCAGVQFLGGITAKDNAAFGFNAATASHGNYTLSLTTSGNLTGSLQLATGSTLDVGNFAPSEVTIASISADQSLSYLAAQKYNGTATDSRIYKETGIIVTDTSTRHTGSGVSWNLQPNANAVASYPLTWPMRAVMVDTSATTMKAYLRHDNAAVVNGVTWPGGYVPGVASDVSMTDSGSINTWTQGTLTATATDNGGFEPTMFAHAAGASGKNAWVDDVSWS